MFLTYLCTTLLLMTGFLLLFIVLLQRGRGGGLAGAFGGLGGQSAFGTKAGDVFTKITIILAMIWVGLAGVTGFAMRHDAKDNPFSGKKKAPVITDQNKTKPETRPLLGPKKTETKKTETKKTETKKTETKKTETKKTETKKTETKKTEVSSRHCETASEISSHEFGNPVIPVYLVRQR